MPGYAVKRIDEMEGAYRGALKKARAELGVTSFGLQVIDMPPNADRYPEHDHSADGQEEVYTVLQGAAMLKAGDQEYRLEPGMFARVGPAQRRKLVTESEGARILAVGATAGRAYEIAPFTQPQNQ